VPEQFPMVTLSVDSATGRLPPLTKIGRVRSVSDSIYLSSRIVDGLETLGSA
jgi:hypothetical protein